MEYFWPRFTTLPLLLAEYCAAIQEAIAGTRRNEYMQQRTHDGTPFSKETQDVKARPGALVVMRQKL